MIDKRQTTPTTPPRSESIGRNWGISKNVEMMPGMPSEVMIETGETTVALYALAPVIDSFHRAFREQ